MTTFVERKQARIAAGPQDFRFVVVAGFPFSGEELGTFESRKAAEEFAFRQRGSTVGNTAAQSALYAAHRKEHVPASVYFDVVRKSAAVA